MDEENDEISMEDSSDDYDQEQLEIALYSQIHFQQGDENQHIKNNQNIDNTEDSSFDNDYIVNVEGNEKTGYVAIESNADIILNNDLEKRYSNTNNVHEDANRKEDAKLEKAERGQRHAKLSSRNLSLKKRDKKFLDNFTSSENETKKAFHAYKSERGGKLLTAEELILGVDSENDDDVKFVDDDEAVCLSDNSGVALSVSEADSLDIVLGEPEERIYDIQMNVQSTPRYTYRKMSHEDALPDEEKHSDDKSNWAICREDSYRELMSATTRHGRYYKPIKCHNCDKEGHLSKNCPKPKKVIVCIMCAEPGHISRTCPQAMCFNCNEPGHDSKSCTYPRRSFNYTCYRCNMKGHDQNRCPDNWRQFHVTVTPEKIEKLAVQTKRKTPSCFNCGEEGHLGHECEEERMNRFSTVCTPFICKYQTMKEFSYKMRRADEAEDRPLKRSKSDSWLCNKASTIERFKPNRHIKFEDEKPGLINVPLHITDNLIKGKKRTSDFAHIARKRSENKTGRNNFDNLQFTLLNMGKGDTGKKTEVATGNNGKKKSKRDKKGNGKEKAVDDFGRTGNKDKELHKRRKDTRGEQSKGRNDKKNFTGCDNFKGNGKQFNNDKSSNMRTITLKSSNADFTISSKNNFSKDLNSGETNTSLNTKGQFQQPNLGRVGQKRKGDSELETVVVDLTFDNDTDRRTSKEKREENQGQFSNLRNDRLRSDDLFSLNKIAKLQSSGQFDRPAEVDGDIEHQVHNNEWWKKRKNHNQWKQRQKRNRKRNKVNLSYD